jgi:hypothetical protein
MKARDATYVVLRRPEGTRSSSTSGREVRGRRKAGTIFPIDRSAEAADEVPRRLRAFDALALIQAGQIWLSQVTIFRPPRHADV